MPLTFLAGVLIGVLASSAVAVVAGGWAYRRVRILERRTRQAERLAELGMLTGGLAHEIKNPLSTLQLNLQLLREDLADRVERLERAFPVARDPDADERRKALSRMTRRIDALARESSRLREILDDFLRYAGRIEPSPELTDVAKLAGDLADFLAPQAQAGRVSLRTELPSTPLVLDPKLVNQALLNLTLNAIQHTPAGGEVRLGVTPDRNGQVRLWVADTGRGIPVEEQAKVFDPYFTRRRGGTGLGLALVRRIAEAHDGRVELESTPGHGSIFSLVFPPAALSDPPAHDPYHRRQTGSVAVGPASGGAGGGRK
jgi:signal transduction histidine kinase